MAKKKLMVSAMVAVFGCLLGCGCPCGFPSLCNPCQWLMPVVTYVGAEFLMDNDAVFDLFQDDFGTGAEYDDRNIALLGGVPSRDEPLP